MIVSTPVIPIACQHVQRHCVHDSRGYVKYNLLLKKLNEGRNPLRRYYYIE